MYGLNSKATSHSSFNRVKSSQRNFISEGNFCLPFFFASLFRHFAGRGHFLSPTRPRLTTSPTKEENTVAYLENLSGRGQNAKSSLGIKYTGNEFHHIEFH